MRIRKLLTILLTIAMVVSLLPATAFAANNTATTMRLAKTQGTVTVTNATGKNVKQTGNMKLYNGYKVKTGAKSYVWISLDDTKVAKLDANSVMEVQKQGKSLALYLSSGNMFFNVKDPLKSGETFSIKTSTMTTGIRGTSGCVRVISPRVTEIHLLTGEVQVYAEHPVLGLSKTATLKAGQKATSLIDWEAIAATGEMVDILIERLENHEICGICSKEIANDPALLERIEREAPHLLPEKAAAEADERLAADEAKAEEKQAAIEKAVAEQVFPEDVDPYFEEKEGGGGGAAASKIVNVATWRELLQAIADYNGGSGTTQINLTATVPTADELAAGNLGALPAIADKGALILNLGKNTLNLNDTLINNSNLTITNVDGYIIGNGWATAVQNNKTLTLKDGQIDGNGGVAVENNGTFTVSGGEVKGTNALAVVNNANAIFTMTGGELIAPTAADQQQPAALYNKANATATISGGTIWSGDANMICPIGINNEGTLTISGGTVKQLQRGVVNLGTASMNGGMIIAEGDDVYCGVMTATTFTMSGGTVEVNVPRANAINMSGGTMTMSGTAKINVTQGNGLRSQAGTLNLDGGTITSNGTTGVYINGSTTTLNGITVTANAGTGVEVATGSADFRSGKVYAETADAVAVNISGQAATAKVDPAADIRGKAELNVFKTAVNTQWPGDAVLYDDTANSGYWILSLSQNGDENLAAVFVNQVISYNHSANDTITLTDSITVDSALLEELGVPALAVADSNGSTNKLTIDLNGKELNLPDIVFENQGNLALVNSVKGGGIKVGALDGTNNAGIRNNGGSLTLDGAPIYVYSGYGVYSTDPNEAPNITASFTMDNGMITTEGGTGLKVDKGAVYLNGGEITAEGGTAVDFTGMNPGISGGFGTEIKANVERGTEDVYLPSLPTGYEFVRNDTYYVLTKVTTVTADAFLDAVDSYEGTADEVVKLYEDTAVTAETLAAVGLEPTGLVSDPTGLKTLTIDLAGKTLTLNAPLVNEGSMIITDSVGSGKIVKTAAALGDRMIQNTGALTLALKLEKGAMTVPHGAIGVDNSGTFNMNGGSMDVIYTTGIQNSSIVNLNGGTITMPQEGAPEGVTEETAIAYAAYMQTGESAELTMAGTKITVEKDIEYTHTDGTSSAVCAVYIGEGSSATMKADTIITVGTDTGISNRGTLNFESGKIIVDGGADASSNTTGIETFGTLTMGSDALVEVARGTGILIGADTTLSAGKVNTTLMEYRDESGAMTLEDWAPVGIYVYGGQTTLTLDGVDIEAHAGVGVALASGKTNFGSGTSIAAYNTAGAVSLIEVNLASTVTRPVKSTITWAYDSDYEAAAEAEQLEINAEYAMYQLFGSSYEQMSCTGPVTSGDYTVYTFVDNAVNTNNGANSDSTDDTPIAPGDEPIYPGYEPPTDSGGETIDPEDETIDIGEEEVPLNPAPGDEEDQGTVQG